MEVKQPKHRLKQRELVMNIFFLFEREYERSPVESIWEIKLPIEYIKKELGEIYSVHYRSNLWIHTQLRRYEEELGVRLFRKETIDSKRGSFRLSIHDRMLKFHQKRHLYVSDKIKVANGVYDKIVNEAAERRAARLRIYLGAGSTIFHLASIFVERAWRDPFEYCIHTHNLGVLKRLLEPAVNFANLTVHTPKGRLDPVTYTILGDMEELADAPPFDYLIMGTSYILDGRLYVESPGETQVKSALLRRVRGQKVLILTKHEFTDKPLPGLEPYGALEDYDFVVVPRHGEEQGGQKEHERLFEHYRERFTPVIIHWNYSILKVRS